MTIQRKLSLRKQCKVSAPISKFLIKFLKPKDIEKKTPGQSYKLCILLPQKCASNSHEAILYVAGNSHTTMWQDWDGL